MLLILILIMAILTCAYFGRRLQTFTIDFIKDMVGSESSWTVAVAMFGVHTISGLVWFLSKIGLPGVKRYVTYSLSERVGFVLRAAYWKARLGKLGRNVLIDVGVHIVNPRFVSIDDNAWVDKNVVLLAGEVPKRGQKFITKSNSSYSGRRGELRIGKFCHLAPNVIVQAHGGVEIGDNCGLASGARIYSLSHHYRFDEEDKFLYRFTPMAPPNQQCLIEGPVVLAGNNAVGLNSVVLPGTTIGKDSWVGVCSHVMKDLPENVIASGNPAQVVKMRQT